MIHERISLILDCHVEVEVVAFSFGYTYGGLLLGIPNDRINQKIYDRISYPEDWGKRKQLKLKPRPTDFISGIKGLPHAHYSVWVYSKYPMNENSDGTQLIITWLDGVPNNKSISDIIYQGIKSVNWFKEATDFNF